MSWKIINFPILNPAYKNCNAPLNKNISYIAYRRDVYIQIYSIENNLLNLFLKC